MLPLERQDAIVTYLKEHHTATVAELSKRFFISETSIRRDLTKLERAGFLCKTYGGAVLVEGRNDVMAFEARQATERTEKQQIARKAVSLIKNGDVIFLDSSSTVLAMAPHLASFSNLTVITHGLKMALSLASFSHLKIYVAGGFLAPNLYSCNGSLTALVIRQMHADKCFLSPRGLDFEAGVFCASEEEAHIRRIMMDRSNQTILVCDTKKIGQWSFAYLCALNEVDALVCDKAPEGQWARRLKESNITLL
ncbi:MAG: DeoR/GlpR family DNA-binding transcription regulator [Christensenellales bacterium]|jgi:DeoR/GlpR family transcriptional regulator of sugar metabolism